MRTVPPALATALATNPRPSADCVVIEAADGARARFTTWDWPVSIDLGLGFGSESCAESMSLSALTLARGMEASSFEITGKLGGQITRNAVLGRRWTGARAWLAWASPGTAGMVPMLGGKVAEVRIDGGAFVMEVRNGADAFNQTIGRILTPYCDADFGDARCGVVRTPYPATISAVPAGGDGLFRFTTSLGGAHADGFFNLGEVVFTSGALAGIAPVEVFAWVGASGVAELYAPLPDRPEVGDAITLYRGCSKLMVSDDPAVPTCKSWNNGLRFRGHPDMPGNDFYLKTSPPGAAGA